MPKHEGTDSRAGAGEEEVDAGGDTEPMDVAADRRQTTVLLHRWTSGMLSEQRDDM